MVSLCEPLKCPYVCPYMSIYAQQCLDIPISYLSPIVSLCVPLYVHICTVIPNRQSLGKPLLISSTSPTSPPNLPLPSIILFSHLLSGLRCPGCQCEGVREAIWIPRCTALRGDVTSLLLRAAETCSKRTHSIVREHILT